MSTAMEAMFAGRVYEVGHAVRRTTLRHTHLANPPLGLVIWRLGGERFRAAAIAWGSLGGDFELAVAGEPRNRDLYFAALAPFAVDLCATVQARAAVKVVRRRGSHEDLIPSDAVQVVVPNRTTISALSLLGRYLAYLSDRGGKVPPPALVEAGWHLRFFGRQARVAGQALVVPLDRLLFEHWATLMSPFEQANLAALNAQIDPPNGVHAFEASVRAESMPVGPEPTEEVDRITAELLTVFNRARGGSTDPEVINRLIGPMQDHYRRLIDPVWKLMAQVVMRERLLPAAPSVASRFEEDRVVFGRHVDWVTDGGRYRTRETTRQAVMALRRLEDADTKYEASKALEDSACMIPYLLSGEAVRGTVASVNDQYRVLARTNRVRRALMTLDTDDPVTLPASKELWWTATANDHPWKVISVTAHGAGSRIVLMLTGPPTTPRLPRMGDIATLSVLHTRPDGFSLAPPQNPPWTHKPPSPPPASPPIDLGDDEEPAAAVDGARVPDPLAYS